MNWYLLTDSEILRLLKDMEHFDFLAKNPEFQELVKHIVYKINMVERFCFFMESDPKFIGKYDPSYKEALRYYKEALIDFDKIVHECEEAAKSGSLSASDLDKEFKLLDQQIKELYKLLNETHGALSELYLGDVKVSRMIAWFGVGFLIVMFCGWFFL